MLTCSVIRIVVVAPVTTSAGLIVGWNPASSISTSYSPGGSDGTEKLPSVPVCTTRDAPVSLFVTVTVALGRTALT